MTKHKVILALFGFFMGQFCHAGEPGDQLRASLVTPGQPPVTSEPKESGEYKVIWENHMPRVVDDPPTVEDPVSVDLRAGGVVESVKVEEKKPGLVDKAWKVIGWPFRYAGQLIVTSGREVGTLTMQSGDAAVNISREAMDLSK